MLRAVTAEHRMGEIGGLPHQVLGKGRRRFDHRDPERAEEPADHVLIRRLVHGDAEVVVVDEPDVDPGIEGSGDRCLRLSSWPRP